MRIYLKIKDREELGELGCRSVIVFLSGLRPWVQFLALKIYKNSSPVAQYQTHYLESTPPISTVAFHGELGPTRVLF